VRNLPAAALDRPSRGVVDVAPARGRADVESQDERVECVVQPDALSSGHQIPTPVDVDVERNASAMIDVQIPARKATPSRITPIPARARSSSGT